MMLIKGGVIHTMTEQGCFQGDILIRHGRIEAVEKHISVPEAEQPCVLHAEGLMILPGMFDMHIRNSSETAADFWNDYASSGVTGGLLWPEEEGLCKLLLGEEQTESRIFALQQVKYDQAALTDRLQTLMQQGYHAACEVHSPSVCRQILAASKVTGVPVILADLSDCEALTEEIAKSGCAAVVGASHAGGQSWKMAFRLQECSVPAALTCNYPDAKLRYFPICAALCVREGMDRQRAMEAITRAPAALYGLPDVGMIQPGARADLAIYDGDPFLLATSHVMTIVRGKIRH